MNILRSVEKLFVGKPYLFIVRLSSNKVRVTIERNKKPLTHNEVIKLKALPEEAKRILAKQSVELWADYFLPLSEVRVIIPALKTKDTFQVLANEVEELELITQPKNFKIVWRWNHNSQYLDRELIFADGYLGDGWFYRSNKLWQVEPTLSSQALSWLEQASIPGKFVYDFVSTGLPLFENIPHHSDLSIEHHFDPRLKITKILKQKLDFIIESTHPKAQGQITTIQGDQENLILDQVILPGWRTRLRGKLIDIFNLGKEVRIGGIDLLAFIQDDVKPNAHYLQFPMESLPAEFCVLDPISLPLSWKIEHTLIDTIGHYKAVPGLINDSEFVSLEKLNYWNETSKRFFQIGTQWFEITQAFKQQLTLWDQKNVGPFRLAPQEVMETSIERIHKVGLKAPSIVVERTGSEQEQARTLIECMREHGLPVLLSGLQNDLGAIIAHICRDTLSKSLQARILWLIPRKRKQEAIKALVAMNVPVTDHLGLRRGAVFVASPDEISNLKHDWTFIVFHDLDIIAPGENQAKALAALRCDWSISIVTRADWHQDSGKAQRLLQVLGLTKRDIHTFLRLCTGNYSNQQISLFSRLISPFKKVTISGDDDAYTKGDVPIPPRLHTPQIEQKGSVYKPRFENEISDHYQSRINYQDPAATFVTEAKRYVDRIESETEAVPFSEYWPTYSSMNPAQHRWYFYWRSQVRRGNYLPADKSYLFVHIYEVLNLVGFNTAQDAFDYLVRLWENYRTLYRLDGYLVNWIADFTAVHKVSTTPLEWYARSLELGGLPTEKDVAIEAWATLRKDFSNAPVQLIRMLSHYDFTRSKFYEKHNTDEFVDRAMRQALAVIDKHLRETSQQSFLDTFRPTERYDVSHKAFGSALVIGNETTVTIGSVPNWTQAEILFSSATGIIKYTENLLRQDKSFRGSLRGIELQHDWAVLLDRTFAKVQPDQAISGPQPFSIDYTKVSNLHNDSDAIRERLSLNEDDVALELDMFHVANSPDNTLKILDQSPRQLHQETLSTRLTERPDGTPDHLLTDLKPVLAILEADSTGTDLFKCLRDHNWEMDPGLLSTVLQGAFLSLVVDRINEKALEHLGDHILFFEDDQIVVTEDYRDELEYLLRIAVPQDNTPKTNTMSTSDHEVTPEWATFAEKMKWQHWEVLNILLLQDNVPSRLDAIARNVYMTPNLLIDEINEYAISSLGDIVIQTDNVPTVEPEDLGDLKAIMAWALKHQLTER